MEPGEDGTGKMSDLRQTAIEPLAVDLEKIHEGKKMADPFEVRMRFTSQLQHLNASVNSAQKAAHYAIKYRDMDEDLHSCILEQLERNSMNNRANIFYFIEQLCDMALRENHPNFVNMIRRDIYRIVDAVAPSDGSGAANVKVVRKGLPKLQQQSVIDAETLTDLEAALKEREVSMSHPGLSPHETDPKVDPNSLTTPRPNGMQKLDKRQIEQRIEEDRERHKRLKESIWGVGGDEYEEADKMWDEGSDIGEDDLLAAEEETADKLGISVEELQKSL